MSTPRSPSTWHRSLLVVLLVALTVLAGCSGGGGPSADATATATPTAAGTDAPDDDSGATATPAGATPTDEPPAGATFDETYEQSVDSMEQRGSYTVDYEFESSGESGSAQGEGTIMIDLERQTMYQTLSVGSGGQSTSLEYYLPPDGDTLYMRFESGGRTFYQKQSFADSGVSFFTDPVRSNANSGSSDVETGFEQLPEFRDEGIVQTEQGPLHKYVVDDTSQLDAATREAYGGEVTELEIALYVDDDSGLPARYEFTLTVDPEGDAGPQTTEMTVVYRNIGSTTVSEPGWYDEAKQQAN